MRTTLLLIALLLLPCRAFAEAPPDARAAAKQHYESGEKAFRLGDFDKAISEWRESYQLSSVPLLLYNIAQAYRQKGDNKQALFFYQQFVATGPTGEARQIAERRIEELKQVLAALEKAQTAPPQGPTPSPITQHPPSTPAPTTTMSGRHREQPHHEWYKSIAAWILVATGLTATATGTGLFVHGNGLDAQIPNATSLSQTQQLQHDRDTYRTVGAVLLGVGGAALASGIIVFAVRAGRRRSESVAIYVTPTVGGLTLGGAW